MIDRSNLRIKSLIRDRGRCADIHGVRYSAGLFPMLFIFILISFAALFDDMTDRLFEKSKRREAIFLGFANLVTAITVEDFTWFVNRWLVSLEDDPKGEQLMQFLNVITKNSCN
jgi:hypothetical protein